MKDFMTEIEEQRFYYERPSHLRQQQKTNNSLTLEQRKIQRILTEYSNLPFWHWDLSAKEHAKLYDDYGGKCCFNHAVGLPRKGDKPPLPLFDYEHELYDAVLAHKRVWVKKATGLGVTEFMLRFMAWYALEINNDPNHNPSGTTFCIITGPRIDLAIDLINRLKSLFHTFSFEDKNTLLNLGTVKIEAFPSHHLASMRGLPNVRFILLDEADFFPLGQQDEARTTVERYIGKSDAYIVLVSTPNAPGGLFQQIEEEVLSLYYRMTLGWQRGLGKIYSQTDIDAAKRSPSFEREYNLQYLGSIGNVFGTAEIDRILSTEYEITEYLDDTTRVPDQQAVMGCDPGWGSSSFGIVITTFIDGKVRVVYADQLSRQDHSEMVSVVWDLIQRFNVTKVLVDASAPSFIRALKLQWGERVDYEQLDRKYREYMRVEPVPFNTEHRGLLYHTKFLVENQYVMVHPTKFERLVTAMRSAYARDGVLDKDATTYDDLFDALRLALRPYKERNESSS